MQKIHALRIEQSFTLEFFLINFSTCVNIGFKKCELEKWDEN
jgi:hypothetical protein